jgi:3-hydroxybutyrate dehydrogenase
MLKNKTALVTGSTSGIGLGIAKALAAQGANIVLNGFGDVEGPTSEISALGVNVAYHPADMSRPPEIEDMMKFAQARFGCVDILVNNAGIQHVARIENFPLERWDAVIAINLSSAFHATRLALPAMRAADQGRGWGRIINLASVHGMVASAEKSAYVAAKHGLIGLTKVTALENATTGVTCNAICPAGYSRHWFKNRLTRRPLPRASAMKKPPTVARRKGTLTAIHDPRRPGRTGGLSVLTGWQQRARCGLEHGWRLGSPVTLYIL